MELFNELGEPLFEHLDLVNELERRNSQRSWRNRRGGTAAASRQRTCELRRIRRKRRRVSRRNQAILPQSPRGMVNLQHRRPLSCARPVAFRRRVCHLKKVASSMTVRRMRHLLPKRRSNFNTFFRLP